jgi:hypothetical protein
VFCNMRACKAVTLRTLNRQRAAILLRHWAKTQVVLTPEEVSAREAVVHVPGLEFGATSIILGASAAQLAVADDLPALFRAGTPGSAVVAEDSTAPRWPFRRSLLVGLQDRASPLDTIEAFFRAALCAEASHLAPPA